MNIKKPFKYLTEYPELMAEWNWERNKGLDPSALTFGSEQRVWWKCSEGHEWTTPILYRTKGHGCPICAGRRAVPLVNDLLTLYPALAKEWHPTLNIIPIPIGIVPSRHDYAVWQCKHGHIWTATIYGRAKTQHLHDCPYCAEKKDWNKDEAMEHIQQVHTLFSYQRRFLRQMQPYIQEYYKSKKGGK